MNKLLVTGVNFWLSTPCSPAKKQLFSARDYLGLFVLLLFVSLWTQAQENNNSNAATVNSKVESSTAGVEFAAREKGIWLTFGLDRVQFLEQRRLAGIALWQYLASIIYIFLALYISKFLDYFTRAYLKKWAEKTETKLDDLLIGLIDGPIKVIVFVILLHIGLTALDWPPTVRTYLSRALTVVVAVSLTYAAVRALDLLVTHWRRRAASELDRTFEHSTTSSYRSYGRSSAYSL